MRLELSQMVINGNLVCVPMMQGEFDALFVDASDVVHGHVRGCKCVACQIKRRARLKKESWT